MSFATLGGAILFVRGGRCLGKKWVVCNVGLFGFACFAFLVCAWFLRGQFCCQILARMFMNLLHMFSECRACIARRVVGIQDFRWLFFGEGWGLFGVLRFGFMGGLIAALSHIALGRMCGGFCVFGFEMQIGWFTGNAFRTVMKL